MRKFKTVERFADTIVETSVEIETRSAVVDYGDILDACEITEDTDHGAPWEEMDGWEHELERLQHDNQEHSLAYLADKNRVIVPTDSDLLNSYKWHRQAGCSKQVAREMMALERRKRIESLLRYRENGWEWYQVGCEFMDRSAGCGGVDSYEYARDEVCHEITSEIVYELEQDGYVVANRPDQAKIERQAKRDRLKRNLRLDCWTD